MLVLRAAGHDYSGARHRTVDGLPGAAVAAAARCLSAGLREFGSTPGVFICTTCALWAARRIDRAPVGSSTRGSLRGGCGLAIFLARDPPPVKMPILSHHRLRPHLRVYATARAQE